MPTVSFIIPAFNEAATIAELISRVEALPFDKQLVIVDDGSTDGTAEILAELSAGRTDMLVIRQANKGKGAAIRAAIPHLTGEIAVIQDADLASSARASAAAGRSARTCSGTSPATAS